MKKRFLFLGFLFIVIQIRAQTPPTYISSDYSLVFNDEFNLASSKTTNWVGDDRNGRDIEWNLNAIIADGTLKLKNIKLASQQSDGRQFTAPSGHTLQSFKYGYFECRYKYAASKGFNNAFWLLADNAPLDVDYMEMDINEGVLDEGGKRENKIGTIDPSLDQVRPLILDHTNGSKSKAAYFYSAQDLSSDFHTYGFEWTPDSLIFYFDGIRLLAKENNLISSQSSYRWLNYPMQVYLSSFNSASYLGFDQAVNSEMVVDYVRVYQKPSQIGLPSTMGASLIKNGDFPSYNTADYGSGIKYTWNTNGDVNSGYLKVSSPSARTNALYMPQQFINVPATGFYDFSFKARIIDNNNSSSIGLKISDNTSGYANSIVTNITPLTAGSNISSFDMLVNSAVTTSTWKIYRYRIKLEANANAIDCRIGFYLNNTQLPAVFEIDDVSLEPVPVSNIFKDGSFNYDFKEASTAGITDLQWTALSSWTKAGETSVTSTTQIIEESSNRYIRKVVAINNSDYQVHISQYSAQVVTSGKYKLKFKARCNAPSATKQIRILLSAENSLTTNVISNATNASNGINFVSGNSGYLTFETVASWTEYTVDLDLMMPLSNYLRFSFRFLQSGEFDLDDVSIEPVNTLPLTLLSFNALNTNNSVNLKWETMSESNVRFFDIQSSIDGVLFYSIGKLGAKGNNSYQTLYSFIDVRKFANGQYIYYRLNCIDYDGSNKYSEIRFLKVADLNNREIKIYPTVVKTILNIDLGRNSIKLPVNYLIYNSYGDKVKDAQLFESNSKLDVSLLSSGIYIIRFPDYPSLKFLKE